MSKFIRIKKYFLLGLAITGPINIQAQTTKAKLQTVFTDSIYQLTGVAVSQSGRIFTNYPRWAGPYRYALAEVGKNNTAKPYPNIEWNQGDVAKGGNKEQHFLCVQAVVTDGDALWVIDAGYAQNAEDNNKGQKLVKINLRNNTVEKVFPMHSVAGSKSYLNDMRIDTKKQIGYITNSGEGGIIIVNLKTGSARQVLLGNNIVKADADYTMQRDGKPLLSNGKPFRVDSDGIALNPDNSLLYFKALTDDKLYRIATRYLNDANFNDTELALKVEYLGTFTTTDGMAFDAKGNLYMGDLERRRIIRLTPDLKLEEVIADDERLAWPDSYQVTKDGWLYISCSRIDEESRFHNGNSARTGAYTIYKTKID
ncbi:SMP-30/gluconolactonase/LRE family protein [Flavobacterium subsaxonicum]|uniref:SMP-30/gluconolactonase/LRE family protein n=1 Tax=Flavobacterium subsaxonicum TaxID=426226 RepID=UPI000688FE47|nr:L-dopachrome tautomerase-related protein [Flavobacterium subsaxonicum]